jgi:hypothetical protein
MAAITRGLRRPRNTAKTRNGIFSGAYAMAYSYTGQSAKGVTRDWAAVALMGKLHHGANTVLSNAGPNFVNIVERFRVERVAAHAGRCRRA